MKIQIVTQFFYPDNFRINDIVRLLLAAGHEVQVLTGLPDYATGRAPDGFREPGVSDYCGAPVTRVKIWERRSGVLHRALNYLSFPLYACRYARRHPSAADVIIVFQTSPIFQAYPAMTWMKRHKMTSILLVYDLWPESLKSWHVGERNPLFLFVKFLSGRIYRAFDRVCISSKPFRSYLTDVCGVDDGRIYDLPSHAEDLYADIAGVYEENGCFDLVFAGNMGAVQSLDTAIRAVAGMESQAKFCLHLVGDGSQKAHCEALAAQLGVGERVKFHGRHPLDAMPRFYKLADAFLLSLRGGDFIGQTLPAKMQSYMSVGKAILVSADGAARQLVEETGCGLAAAAGDVEALSRIMDEAILSSELRAMGDLGRAYYLEHFTQEQYMARLEALLNADVSTQQTEEEELR